MNENILKSETKSYNTSIQQPINADVVNKLVNEQGISNTFFILGMIFLVSFFLTLSVLIKKLVEVAKKIVEAVIESIYGLKDEIKAENNSRKEQTRKLTEAMINQVSKNNNILDEVTRETRKNYKIGEVSNSKLDIVITKITNVEEDILEIKKDIKNLKE